MTDKETGPEAVRHRALRRLAEDVADVRAAGRRMDARVTALRAALRAGVPLTVAQRDELATARRESDRLAADLARLQARFRALRDRADGADGAGA